MFRNYISIFCISLISLLVLSCTNEPVSVQRQIKVTVSPSMVLDNFIAYSSEHKEMYQDDELGKSKLRITALLYDADGMLVQQSEELLNDYNSDYTFSVNTDSDETYTLLCFSSAVLGPSGDFDGESYEFTGVEKISTLKVTQTDEASFASNWSVLGFSTDMVSGDVESMEVMLQPATAFVYLQWLDIHANGDGVGDDVSGTYKASAYDLVTKETISWEIIVEQNGDKVVVKNLSPFYATIGISADNGYNIYEGYIENGYIILPEGQKVGFEYEGKASQLYGIQKIESNTIYVDDIYLKIDSGRLVAEKGLSTYLEDTGWLEVFDSKIEFNRTSDNSSGFGVDDYYIIYHNNDVVSYDMNQHFYYRTTLDGTSNSGRYVTPSKYPDAKNIYEYINLLPGEFNSFARMFIGNSREDFSEQNICVESGKQYCLSLNCADMRMSLLPGEMKFKSVVKDEMIPVKRIKASKNKGFADVRLKGFRL